MVFAANLHSISHVPGRFACLCSMLGQVEGSVTMDLPQSPPTPISMLRAPAGQQSPVVVPAGKVLDPGVCVSMW